MNVTYVPVGDSGEPEKTSSNITSINATETGYEVSYSITSLYVLHLN
jgi:hypothetical protein